MVIEADKILVLPKCRMGNIETNPACNRCPVSRNKLES
jgi:hypothetical protein